MLNRLKTIAACAAAVVIAGCGGGSDGGGGGSSGGGVIQAPETASVPVAKISGPPISFAPVISNYTGENYKFDGGASTDPNGKPLSYEWKMVSAPTGFPGFSWNSSDGKQIGFWSGPGTYVVSLTVSNGSQISLPVTASVEVCCVADKAAYQLNKFGFPVYSQDYIKQKFNSYNFKSLKDSLAFGIAYHLSAFQMDYLNGLEPGTAIKVNESLAGGATITGYSLPFKGIIQIPVDFTTAKYPDDFLPSKAVDASIVNPYCDLEPTKISYPAKFAGLYPLPEIRHANTVKNYRKIAALTDHWTSGIPAYIPGCVESSEKAIQITLSRLKQLNVDTIFLTPWSIFDASKEVWKVLGPDVTLTSMNDSDLTKIVGAAKQAGFKVYWTNQIQIAQRGNNQLTLSDAIPENIIKSFDALDQYMQERGAFLQSINIDGVFFQANYWTSFDRILNSETFASRTAQTIRKLKIHFKGKILYDHTDSIAKSPQVINLIDEFYASVWGPNLTKQEASAINVDLLKEKFLSTIKIIRNSAGSKLIVWGIGTPSWVDYYWSSAFLDLSFCIQEAGQNPRTDLTQPCIQREIPTDFSIQAIAHEASMEALSDSGELSNNAVAISGYLIDSNLFPSTTFPNLDSSIRGKPAEYIIYKWFQPQ
jgi:hypothetical protein